MVGISNVIPELKMGVASLYAHKLRSLLTMLGMIFGVGAVVAMLSITAGAQKEMMSFIDQLGVNNIIVEAREAVDRNELQTVRATSPGSHVPRFPGDFGKRFRTGGHYAAQAVQTPETAPQDQSGISPTHRRAPEFRGDQQSEARFRALLQRRRE